MAHEVNSGDASTSDDDSVSLLCNFDACRERDQEKNQIKLPKSGKFSCSQSAEGCPDSTSPSGSYQSDIP